VSLSLSCLPFIHLSYFFIDLIRPPAKPTTVPQSQGVISQRAGTFVDNGGVSPAVAADATTAAASTVPPAVLPNTWKDYLVCFVRQSSPYNATCLIRYCH
jgi:hypothetical protein